MFGFGYMSPQRVDGLYRANFHWLRAWLVGRVGCSQQAADLAQDTFVRLLQSQQQDLSIQEPRAYLRTIAHGLMTDYFRRRSLEQAYQEALANHPEHLEISEEQRYQLLEALDRIDAVLSTLPQRMKTIFLMSQLEGVPYRQIATELAVSERTIKRDMQQALVLCMQQMI